MRSKNTTYYSEIVNYVNKYYDDIGRAPSTREIESGTGKFEAEYFDLTEAVNETIHRYDKMTAAEDYDINFDYDSNVSIYADRSMVLQVIYNLINNAINTIHTITSPNKTIPAAPIVLTIATVNTINNANVNNKIVNNTI
jgi:nitrogen fixation/metabolism regulation signal transduction histidine kinase